MCYFADYICNTESDECPNIRVLLYIAVVTILRLSPQCVQLTHRYHCMFVDVHLICIPAGQYALSSDRAVFGLGHISTGFSSSICTLFVFQ